MTVINKAINTFGFENPIATTIIYLEKQGEHELAEQLYKECEELTHPHWCVDDDLDSTFHFTQDTDKYC